MIYDPKDGDPNFGIAPGTAFEDIPGGLGLHHLQNSQIKLCAFPPCGSQSSVNVESLGLREVGLEIIL